MVKVNLFIADTQSNVPLELNRIARNVHLFKLRGALLIENFKEKLDMGCVGSKLEQCPCNFK